MVSNSPRVQGFQKAAETVIFLVLHDFIFHLTPEQTQPRKKKRAFNSTVRGDKNIVVGCEMKKKKRYQRCKKLVGLSASP